MKLHVLFLVVGLSSYGVLAQKPRLMVPIGHTAEIRAVAFSPDGKLALTGSVDRSAILWTLQGREIQSFRGHQDVVGAVAFSPDGQYVLTGSEDISARIWDLNGNQLLKIDGHAEGITSVAFSPATREDAAGGKFILTGSMDKTARLWDRQGTEVRVFSGHTAGVTAAAFSPNGKFILTASGDKTAKLWDINGKLIQTFIGHAGWIFSVAFSPDGKTILTAGEDNTVKLWDLSGKLKLTYTGHSDRVNSAFFTSSGKQVISASDDGTVKLWDGAGTDIKQFSSRIGYISMAAMSPGGDWVLSGGEGPVGFMWDVRSGREVFLTGHSSAVNAVSWAPDGRLLLTGNSDNSARLWELSQREVISLSGHTAEVGSVSFSNRGDTILTSSRDLTAKTWDTKGSLIRSYSNAAHPISCAQFSPEGRYIATGGEDNAVVLWETQGNAKPIFRHSSKINSLAFAPGGNALLAGGQDGNALWWRLDTGGLNLLSGHLAQVTSVAVSPNSRHLLTGSHDRSAILWSTDGIPLHRLKSHLNWISSVAFSPPTPEDPLGGQYMLTGSWDQTIKLWNTNGECLKTYNGHVARVNAVAFSPNAKYILSGGGDHTLCIWDRRSGELLLTLVALEEDNWVVTAPSGLFDASPGAMNLMYFVVGQEVVELEQLKERYFEPGLLAKVMGYSADLLRSVAGFDSVALYPSVRLDLDSVQHQLRLTLTPRNGGVGKVSIFINDKEITEDALQGRGYSSSGDTILIIALDSFDRFFLLDTLNTLSVRAYNRENWLRSPLHTVAYVPDFSGSKGGADLAPATTLARKSRLPALHLLLVGIADYSGAELDLKYTAKDAKDMASALRQSGAQLFSPDSVFVHLLTTNPGDRQPTKANIRSAFDAIAARAKAEDVFVAYFSGHGTNYGDAEKALFYFLTMEIGSFDLSDTGVRSARAVSSDELTRWINAVPAQKQVLIVDACNSGKVAEDIMGAGGKSLTASQIRAMDRMKDRTGMFILSGSAADQKSFEAGGFRQSLLTYSLLEAMKTGAALTPEKDIDVMRLFQQARDRVPKLAEGLRKIQVPVPAFPKGGSTVFIGRVNDQVDIPLAPAGHVFIRSTFQDQVQFGDPLGLTEAIDNYLIEEDAAGAGFIFVDTRDYAAAYSIKGLYAVKDEEVTLRARLFKGKTAVGSEITLTGKKSDVPSLVEAIVENASGMVK